LTFSPDGKTLAGVVAGEREHLVLVWDVDTGSIIRRTSVTALGSMSLAFSPDAKTLAVGVSHWREVGGWAVWVWDLKGR
jgi:WD40 repeat protein